MLGREAPVLRAAFVLLLATSPAFAEDPGAPSPPPPGEERAGARRPLVTGARAERAHAETASPMIVITREQIAASGKASLGDFLQSLPEQGNAVNNGVNVAGHDGSTRINLRGIGTSRTLVLVNGRRWVAGGAGADDSVDLSSIPSAAVERIEVLKDGASAMYGADAIAGVVNVVTRTGGEMGGSVYTGASSHGDGATFDASLSAGMGNAIGNLFFSAGYAEERKVMARDREFSRVPYFYDPFTGRRISAGSGTIPAGRTLRAGTVGSGNALWATLTNGFGDSYVWDPSASACGTSASGQVSCFRPYRGAGLPEGGAVGDGYNALAESQLLTPERRVQLFSAGDLRLGSSARAFVEAGYVSRRSTQERAPPPLVLDSLGIRVSAQNVYNPFGLDVFVRRRLTELGPRAARQDVDTYRIVGGLGGTAPDSLGRLAGWSWDVSVGWGRSEAVATTNKDIHLPALAAALGPSAIVDGTPVCGTPSSPIPGCVPLNLFGGPGSITPGQLSGLVFTGRTRGSNELRFLQVSASGELLRLASDRPVGLSFGYEVRDQSGALVSTPITLQGVTSSDARNDVRGSYHVQELHAGLSVPLVSGKPFAEDLEATLAARRLDYSTFGSDTVRSLGARWRPVSDVTFRGTTSTALRAPSMRESFTPPRDTYVSLRDPCRGPSAGGPPISDACLAAGVPPSGTGDDRLQLLARVGGNPDLGPETARVRTLGVVLQPRWIRNLALSVAYHGIEIDGVIARRGARTLLEGCYGGSHPEFCTSVTRDPATSFIGAIHDLSANAGKLAISGVDFGVRYATPTWSAGRFAFVLDGTWLEKVDLTLPDGTLVKGKRTFDLSQLDGAGGPGAAFPEWKMNAALTWALGRLGAGVSTRHLSSFRECGSPFGIFPGSGRCHLDASYQREVGAYHAEDAFVSYTARTAAGTTSAMVGVQNLSNAPPPVVYSGFPVATDPYSYDLMGRFFYLRVAYVY